LQLVKELHSPFEGVSLTWLGGLVNHGEKVLSIRKEQSLDLGRKTLAERNTKCCDEGFTLSTSFPKYLATNHTRNLVAMSPKPFDVLSGREGLAGELESDIGRTCPLSQLVTDIESAKEPARCFSVTADDALLCH
jgi:hypothetical protein